MKSRKVTLQEIEAEFNKHPGLLERFNHNCLLDATSDTLDVDYVLYKNDFFPIDTFIEGGFYWHKTREGNFYWTEKLKPIVINLQKLEKEARDVR